jgi:hypothetical protein
MNVFHHFYEIIERHASNAESGFGTAVAKERAEPNPTI